MGLGEGWSDSPGCVLASAAEAQRLRVALQRLFELEHHLQRGGAHLGEPLHRGLAHSLTGLGLRLGSGSGSGLGIGLGVGIGLGIGIGLGTGFGMGLGIGFAISRTATQAALLLSAARRE